MRKKRQQRIQYLQGFPDSCIFYFSHFRLNNLTESAKKEADLSKSDKKEANLSKSEKKEDSRHDLSKCAKKEVSLSKSEKKEDSGESNTTPFKGKSAA